MNDEQGAPKTDTARIMPEHAVPVGSTRVVPVRIDGRTVSIVQQASGGAWIYVNQFQDATEAFDAAVRLSQDAQRTLASAAAERLQSKLDEGA